MNLITTPFDGLYLLEAVNFKDDRGSFQKIFNFDFFEINGLRTDFKEFYFSISHKNVIRGMHFQLPPHDHAKLVYVSRGSIRDVVIDLRKSSNTYKQHFAVELDAQKGRYLYIPSGFAHGFISLTDDTIVNYAQTSGYNQDCDCGVSYDSFGYNWGVETPVISNRDLTFMTLEEFKTTF